MACLSGHYVVIPAIISSFRASFRHPGLDPGSIKNSVRTPGCRLRTGMTRKVRACDIGNAVLYLVHAHADERK